MKPDTLKLSRRVCLLLAMLGAALVALPVMAGDPSDKYPGLNLIPWPKSLQMGSGSLKLDSNSRIVAADKSLVPLAEILSGDLGRATGLKLTVVADRARAGDIVLKINKDLKADEQIRVLKDRQPAFTNDGAHTLTVADQAVLEGFDYRAVAEGTATILQAVSITDVAISLPKLTIKDWPRADYCGVMLDVARQEHPIAAIKQVVEECRLYKVRYLQLHLSDDQGWTFPSTKFPQLGSKNVVVGHAGPGGLVPKVYDLEELKGLVAYADARGVTIVPEIETPGHSEAARRSFPEVFDYVNPETKKMVDLASMNIANEEWYAAMDTIIGEICDVFKSSPFFHFGSDEVSIGKVSHYPGYKAFLAKHGLKGDGDLEIYFARKMVEMIQKHGKKAIKWEGLADGASKDAIVMTWINESRQARVLLDQGYTTITAPWGLGVPWEEWNMYICNGAKLTKNDAVMGATVVRWEQSARNQVATLRENIPSRQERTWGPDNLFTEKGYAKRFNSTDALAGRLLDTTSEIKWPAEIQTTLKTQGLQEPILAIDDWAKMCSWTGVARDMMTWFLSAQPPKKGDHFTIQFKEPLQVFSLEAYTGTPDGKCILSGDLQVSSDGKTFKTVAQFDGAGLGKATLTDNTVKAVRLLASADGTEPLAIPDIRLRQMFNVSGKVGGLTGKLGATGIAVLTGDTVLGAENTNVLVINKGFTLQFNSGGGNPFTFGGALEGTGKIEIAMGAYNGFRDSAMVLAGGKPNTFNGTTYVKAGRLHLSKTAGVDALAGTIVVGGQGDNDCLFWGQSNQINDAASVELLNSPNGGAKLILNGFSEKFDSLKMDPGTKIVTGGTTGAGGVLTVNKLTLAGKVLPKGVYTSAEEWVVGIGSVVVGDVKYVDVTGKVEDPTQKIGAGNVAVLKGAATLALSGDCNIAVRTGDFPLTLENPGTQPVRCTSFISGRGGLTINAGKGGIELGGKGSNSYVGPTSVAQGVLKFNKPAGVLAVPGDLTLGGNTPANSGDCVTWLADNQMNNQAVITMTGTQPSCLDLGAHTDAVLKIVMSPAAKIKVAKGGTLKVRQIVRDGKPLAAGSYTASAGWIEGGGTVTIDKVVNAGGGVGITEGEIQAGCVANLTGDLLVGYPTSSWSVDVITNGHTFTLDSGDGNMLGYYGAISGTGNVQFRMGPCYNGSKDLPLHVGGNKPNTCTGKYYAHKGRVQLEKPDGVDAIAGDVFVGGQGFNDCLYWKHSNQLKDTVNITMLDNVNSGGGYLNLNGFSEKAASLTIVPHTRVVTDGDDGKGGVLTVKTLTVEGKSMPSGTYTAGQCKWIEGTGKVVVP